MLSRSERVSGVWRVFPLYPVHSKNKFLCLFNSSNHIMRQSRRFRETGHRLTLVTWYSEEWYGSRHRLYLDTPVSDMTCDSAGSLLWKHLQVRYSHLPLHLLAAHLRITEKVGSPTRTQCPILDTHSATLLRAPVPFLLPSHNPPHTTYSFELTPLSLCFQWIQHLRLSLQSHIKCFPELKFLLTCKPVCLWSLLLGPAFQPCDKCKCKFPLWLLWYTMASVSRSVTFRSLWF